MGRYKEHVVKLNIFIWFLVLLIPSKVVAREYEGIHYFLIDDYFSSLGKSNVIADGYNAGLYSGDILITGYYSYDEAESLVFSFPEVKSNPERYPQLHEDEHYEVIKYATNIDTNKSYIDVKVTNNKFENIVCNNNVYSKRTYDISSQVIGVLFSPDADWYMYDNHYVIYVIPDQCKDYIIEMGIPDRYNLREKDAFFEVKNGTIALIEPKLNDKEISNSNYWHRNIKSYICFGILCICILLLGKKCLRLVVKKERIRFFLFLMYLIVYMGFINIYSPIKSGSMEPTLPTGSIALYTKNIDRENLQRGDIVSFKMKDTHELVSKRIVAIGGDRVEFIDGFLYINGTKVDERNYITDDVETNCIKTYFVPNDSYFMLGDNRENSYDSRYWDEPFVKREAIVSKLLFHF